jgi:hypothetical protein
MAPPNPTLLTHYSEAVLALWGESDEASTKKWMDDKIADFEAGGKMKEKHETREALDEYMTKTVCARRARGAPAPRAADRIVSARPLIPRPCRLAQTALAARWIRRSSCAATRKCSSTSQQTASRSAAW